MSLCVCGKTLLVGLTFLATGAVASAQIASPTTQEARLVLLQYGYWSGGFDRPLFVALRDGTILFPKRREHGFPVNYSVLRVKPSQVDSIIACLGVGSALYALDSLYDFAPGVTDQHSFYLVLPTSSGQRVIQLRAAFDSRDHLRADVPRAFAKLYSALTRFAPAGAADWKPDSIEVAIWPYEYASDNRPLSWPTDWPNLADERWHRSTDRAVGEVRTLRLPFAAVPRLDSLIARRREKQAIGIGGRKWALDYRWVFPSEAAWAWVGRRLEG